MDIEIRPCQNDDELRVFDGVTNYVFANNEPRSFEEYRKFFQPEWSRCAFVDGRIATTTGAYPFRVRLNGASVAMAGVTAVGTLPNYRRRGLLRATMKEALAGYRKAGQHIAILWASMGAIYQRFGYGLASQYITYVFDPRFVQLQQPPPVVGQVDMLTKDDALPVCREVYKRFSAPRNLMIDRHPLMWEAMLNRDTKPHYFAIWRDGEGTPRGYLIYQTEEPPRDEPEPSPEQVMRVLDFAYETTEAWIQLWEFIRGHDLVERVYMNGVAEDDPAMALLLEPRQLRRRTNDGIWMRIVDVERALPQRPYAESGRLRIGIVDDDLCPWNNGIFEIEADSDGAAVRRVDGDPQLTMRPRALASLLSGMWSATYLARAGAIEAADEAALRFADRAFATSYRPWCPNGF
jgi:predicted acetyltransferase